MKYKTQYEEKSQFTSKDFNYLHKLFIENILNSPS